MIGHTIGGLSVSMLTTGIGYPHTTLGVASYPVKDHPSSNAEQSLWSSASQTTD